MPVHAGPALALFGLLALAGIFKLLNPGPTAGALRAARLPSSFLAVRVLGFAEFGVGVAGVALGSSVAAAVGAMFYGGFAWFVGHALRNRLPISSCGCLGTSDTPPTGLHLVFNLAATVFLLACVMFPIGPLGGMGSASWDAALPFALFVGVTVYLFYGLLAVLPQAKQPVDNAVTVPIPRRKPSPV
ncbi:MAG TPA: MauE/DoxX family redox-associated membrane protein [Acidimicrobiia bacterium]|nr:MauE/DoxX family redox-associated membrane protein [Acidimicrobiia bacterium]